MVVLKHVISVIVITITIIKINIMTTIKTIFSNKNIYILFNYYSLIIKMFLMSNILLNIKED